MLVGIDNMYTISQKMKCILLILIFHQKTNSFVTMITCDLSNTINHILVVNVECN
jgi:hypothetical protein